MILLQRGLTASVIVTASEKATLDPTVFSLSFIHDLTKKEISFPDHPDTSPSPDRYNLFVINMAPFDDCDNGFFTYEVTDQDGNILETGKAKLEGVKVGPVQYEDYPNEYKTYGQ